MDCIKRKGDKIGMGYMKHGQQTDLSTLTPRPHHAIPILLPRCVYKHVIIMEMT